MLNVTDHAIHWLAQEDIQTMLGQMIETMGLFGSDGILMWLWDLGILQDDKLFHVITMLRTIQHH